MKIAHLADMHLGYRAYTRVTSRGLNVREADVFRAFRTVLDMLRDIGPDVVVIAGDMFHSVRPSNFAIHQAFRLLMEFRTHCATPIVIIGGNHDTPKSVDTGCILDLFTAIPGIYVQPHDFQAIALPECPVTVYCLPYFALERRKEYLLKPESADRVNVLAVHGTVEGVMKQAYDAEQIAPGELNLDLWDYAAIGHYHVHTRIASNAFYSGAIEYTSTNIWAESREAPKGFIVYDTESEQDEFHPVPGVRTILDLPVVNGSDRSPDELMAEIETNVQPYMNGLSEMIVRVVVEGFPRQLQKELDWARVRELKSQVLHLDLVLRPSPASAAGREETHAPGARPLEVEWEEFAAGLPDIPRGVDRAKLVDLGKRYLSIAAEQEVAL